MASFSDFIERFRRVTSAGRYMPEIDGLRFIAIFLVCFLFHQSNYLIDGITTNVIGHDSFLNRFIREGASGVALFFIISGFILSLPFAEQNLLNGKPVSLKQYYWRRVTRIEPAYVITLTLYFIMRVWILHYSSFADLLQHFFASLFYIHSIVYNDFSPVNGVAWSLEVEIQFYLLMPLLAGIYLIKNKIVRRILFVIMIIIGCIYSYRQEYFMGNILNKGCYFLSGMLLADLFLLCKKDYNNTAYAFIALICSFSFVFVPLYYVSVWFCLLKLFLMIVFFFFVLFNNTVKKVLSIKLIAIVGGMCYSIYLLHMGVLGLMRHRFVKIEFSHIFWLNAAIQYLLASCFVMIVSAVFFLLVEKPTMRRDWYKTGFK